MSVLQGYATVSHFNVVHYDCHSAAVKYVLSLYNHQQLGVTPPPSHLLRLARTRDEWESAMLQNANTKCNGLMPIWGPEVYIYTLNPIPIPYPYSMFLYSHSRYPVPPSRLRSRGRVFTSAHLKELPFSLPPSSSLSLPPSLPPLSPLPSPPPQTQPLSA